MIRRPIRALVLTALVLAVLVPPSFADEWGNQDGDTGAHPDEDPHTFCFSTSVGSGLRENIELAEYQALDPTDANVNYHATCTMSGQSETDVYWKVGNLSGAYGAAPCNDYEVIGDQCDQYHVTLDLAAINEGANDNIHQTKTACHELGHTAGLSHRVGSCMETGAPGTDIYWRRYDNEHHIPDHINPWF